MQAAVKMQLERESAETKIEPAFALASLTRQELTVLRLLLQGCDNREIADHMHVAKRTVKQYFNRLFLKFQIKDGYKRVKLAVAAYRKRDELGLE